MPELRNRYRNALSWDDGIVGRALAAFVQRLRAVLPRHHLLVDLSPFGLANENEIFVATEEPYGLIEATVTREG